MQAKWMLLGSLVIGACCVGGCSSSGGEEPIATASQASVSAVPVNAPAIDWTTIGQQAPKPLSVGTRAPTDPLPHADVVILTWTVAEWSALDHVFVNSGAARSPTDRSWESSWPAYTRNASQFSSSGGALWGHFRLVQVADQSGAPWRVLLFKSNAHLSFQPWIVGLRTMVQNILADTTPDRIYSIGTAGAARLDQKLGDAVVTNSAFLQVTQTANASDPANGKTFTSPWYPSLTLESSAGKLLFPMSQAATAQDLQTLFGSVFGSSSGVASSDVIDAALTGLDAPKVGSMRGVPLNTSDDFETVPGAGMAPGDGNDPYSAYETDDAVVAQAALQANVKYSSVRNVSDTVVPSTTASGGAISDTLRTNWSSALYYRYGFLTAVNGAIATWATIAGETGGPPSGGAGGAGGSGGAAATGGSGNGGASTGGASGSGGIGGGAGTGAGGAAALGGGAGAANAAPGSSGGCTCAVAGGSAQNRGHGLLALAGLAMAMAALRRRRAS